LKHILCNAHSQSLPRGEGLTVKKVHPDFFEAFIFELLVLKAQRLQYSRPFKNKGTNCNAIVQTADKPIWHASIQPSPTEGKGDREHADAVAGEQQTLSSSCQLQCNCSARPRTRRGERFNGAGAAAPAPLRRFFDKPAFPRGEGLEQRILPLFCFLQPKVASKRQNDN